MYIILVKRNLFVNRVQTFQRLSPFGKYIPYLYYRFIKLPEMQIMYTLLHLSR